ncbi:MAG: hypothetical protein IPK67_11975 [Planctomycetes bacterium]|nr:hypothetical protein [Planctomycetota bacterium]
MEPLRQPGLGGGARRWFDGLTVLVFLALIAAPTLDLELRPDSARSPEERELRPPAEKPGRPATTQEAMLWPGRYEQYFKDSFGLRDVLLRWNSMVKVFALGVSPSSEVYFGREGWLFYTGQMSAENHRGALPFSQDQLESWARVLETKRRLLESMGVRYLHVVAPDKESIYGELLPGFMRPLGPTRYDQLLEYLAAHAPEVEVLDLRPALIAAKRGDSPDNWVYTNLGTHWTGRGSQVALRALVERLERMVGGFHPEELDSYRRVEFSGPGDSWATRMYIGDLLVQRTHGYMPPSIQARIRFEGNFRLGRVRKSEIPDSDRPRLLIMHDSFGPHIEQGLSEQCSYLECRWDFSLDVGEIAAAQPVVYVDMFVERALNTLDPKKTLPVENQPWPRRYARSKTTLVAIDRSASDWGFRALGESQVGPGLEQPRPRLPIIVGKLSDTLEFGPLVPVEGETPVAHIVIDSPFATELTIWYLPEGQADVVRRNGYRAQLRPGQNELYLPLDREGTSGRLFLRPGARGGTYLLRDLEIRSATLP